MRRLNILKAATAYAVVAGRASSCPALWAVAIVGVTTAIFGPGLLIGWLTDDWFLGAYMGGVWIVGCAVVSNA